MGAADVHAVYPAGRGVKTAARSFVDYFQKDIKARAISIDRTLAQRASAARMSRSATRPSNSLPSGRDPLRQLRCVLAGQRRKLSVHLVILLAQRRDPVVEDREREIVGHRDCSPANSPQHSSAVEQPVHMNRDVSDRCLRGRTAAPAFVAAREIVSLAELPTRSPARAYVSGNGQRRRTMTYFTKKANTPVGELTLIASERGLAAILWEGDDPEARAAGASTGGERQRHPRRNRAAIESYFDGTLKVSRCPLDFVGTEFQTSVWKALLKIPFGQTRTYTQIAKQIGRPTAARAVGAASGKNPISIMAPCHRVVGANGDLTGFAGGLDTKELLLELGARWRRTPWSGALNVRASDNGALATSRGFFVRGALDPFRSCIESIAPRRPWRETVARRRRAPEAATAHGRPNCSRSTAEAPIRPTLPTSRRMRSGSTCATRPPTKSGPSSASSTSRIPDEASLSEIEASSRMISEHGKLYLSSPAVRVDEHGDAHLTPIGFVIGAEALVTVRFAASADLRDRRRSGRARDDTLKSGMCVFTALLEAMVDRGADVARAPGRDHGRAVPGRVQRRPVRGKKPVRSSRRMREALESLGSMADRLSRARTCCSACSGSPASRARSATTG